MSVAAEHASVGVVLMLVLFGLASAWLARRSEGSRLQAACQALFMACLALVGSVTVALLLLSPGLCLASGATLATMSVAATWDFGGGRAAA
jgi:hypothetical protein